MNLLFPLSQLSGRTACTLIAGFVFAFGGLNAQGAPRKGQSAPQQQPPQSTTVNIQVLPETPKGMTDSAVDSTGEMYMLPGITAIKNGKWVGGDNMYNMPNNIGVGVEIVKPVGKPLPISSSAIKARIAALFERSGITPQPEGKAPSAPLPFFHMLILIYPIEKGYVAALNGRLFEAVTIPRIILEKSNTWQAITWEKQDLIITSGDLLVEQVNLAIDDITTNFIDRYTFYEKIYEQTKRQLQRE